MSACAFKPADVWKFFTAVGSTPCTVGVGTAASSAFSCAICAASVCACACNCTICAAFCCTCCRQKASSLTPHSTNTPRLAFQPSIVQLKSCCVPPPKLGLDASSKDVPNSAITGSLVGSQLCAST